MHFDGMRPEPGGRAPAPGPLRLVQRVVNSVDLEDGPDDLATPDGLQEGLGGAGGGGGGAGPPPPAAPRGSRPRPRTTPARSSSARRSATPREATGARPRSSTPRP